MYPSGLHRSLLAWTSARWRTHAHTHTHTHKKLQNKGATGSFIHNMKHCYETALYTTESQALSVSLRAGGCSYCGGWRRCYASEREYRRYGTLSPYIVQETRHTNQRKKQHSLTTNIQAGGHTDTHSTEKGHAQDLLT